MATETIDIIVRENGARVVKRNLEEIGAVAERSVRGLRLLQNALFVLGGAGLLSGLTRMLDTLTNFENRLTLVTKSTAELNAVQDELFNIATRTRSSFESTAEVYTRVALAVRQIGLSQRDTLNFTESLNQATILSGASAREAAAALIQLSQGLAAGRLNGDELRSVLEQLPFVADIIAEELGVTRGELRKLGADGKITTQVLIDAFRNAREEIAEKFAKTVPTIGQSFEVFRTQLLRVLDSLDDTTGASAAVARAIIAVANSLDVLVASVIVAGLAFAGWKLGGMISTLLAWASANRQIAAAVAAGNATMLTAVGIEQAKAASSLQAAQAQSAETASTLAAIQADIAQLNIQRSLLLQQQASITIDNQRRIARDALTGRFIAYNAAVAQNIRTNIALQRTETALLATKGQLTSAVAAQTAATNALSAAQTRATAANAAASGIVARLSTMFPGLAAIVRGVSAAFMGLWAVIVANPIGAIIALIVAAVAALVLFSDKISVSSDGLVTLRNVGIATFQLIMEAIAPVGQFLIDTFQPAFDWIGKAWDRLVQKVQQAMEFILGIIKAYINFQIGLWDGLISSIIRAWDLFPAAFGDVLIMAYNSMIQFVEDSVNGFIDGFLSLPRRAQEVFESVANFGRQALDYIVNAFRALPSAIAALADQAATFLKNNFVEAINYIIGLLNNLPGIAIDTFGEIGTAVQDAFTLPEPPNFNDYVTSGGRLDLSSLKRETSGAAQEVATIFSEEFTRSINTDYIGNAWNAIIERARQVSADRIAAESADLNAPGTPGTTPPGSATGGAGGNQKTFEQLVAELARENELLKVNAAEREKLQAIIQMEEQLKRSLTEAERALVMELLNENEVLNKAAEIYESVRGPAYEYQLTLEALNRLLQEGRINQQEFTNEVIKARIEFLNSQTDMASGMERGFLKILQKTGDYATQIENIITTAFDGMSQAIADLVVDGEADFGSLIRSINKMIVQLVVSQAFQQLFGGTGVAGGQASGNIFSSLFSGLKGLFGFQNGGSFMVNANNGIAPLPNGGNDNRLVAFRAQDGEQVTVTPRGQSPAGGSNQQVIVNFNITTPDVAGFRASESQLAAKAARMIGRGQRNM